MSKKLSPELLTRTALNGVVSILRRPYPDVLPKDVSDVAMVLFDQITELWPTVSPITSLYPTNSYSYSSLVGHDTLLYRWLVIDAIRTAELCGHQSNAAKVATSLVKNWVLSNTEENRFKIEKLRNIPFDGSSGTIAASNLVYVITTSDLGIIRNAVVSNTYLATHNQAAEIEAGYRVGLLSSLRNLLPEPVPSVFEIEHEGLQYPDDLIY